jgi:hypothetical protein
VDVQVVYHEVPARGRGVGGGHPSEVVQEIGFRAGRSTRRRDEVAAGDIAAEDERAGAVTDVLELAALGLSRRQRQIGMLALECLYARQLVGARDPLAAGR